MRTDEGATPQLFISHRHEDRDIARRLRQALVELLENRAKVWCTSDDSADGLEFGRALTPQIQKALSTTCLVILLYTSDEADWRWCFFECGVAMHPEDEVPTRTVVFDFDTTEGSKIFDGDLHVVITGDDPADIAKGVFRHFCADLVNRPEYLWPEPADAATIGENQIAKLADQLWDDLVDLGPAAQKQLTDQVLKALTSVPAAGRRAHFHPLFEGASEALKWGLDDRTGVSDLFVEYWNDRFLNELTTLAQRRLVFRPGRLYLHWDKLLSACRRRFEQDPVRMARLGRPVVSLVSHEAGELTAEDGGIDLKFWLRAAEPSTDPWFYEQPLRELARALTALIAEVPSVPVQPVVERVFLLDRPQVNAAFAARAAEVFNAMAGSDIAVAVAFEDRLSEQDLTLHADYGIIGDLAVSRFRADDSVRREHSDGGTDPTNYRSLVEDFDPAQVETSVKAWQRLQEQIHWRLSPGATCEPDELTAALTGAPVRP